MTRAAGASLAVGPRVRVRFPVLTLAILGAVGLAVLGARQIGLLDDILSRWDDITYLTAQHIQLVAVSGGLAIATGVPIGIWLSRPSARSYAEAVMQTLNVGSTIPTLAKIALAMTVLGIGNPPAIVALWIVTLLPVARNTFVGLREVPGHFIEAATGMGMSPRQILWRVELPNALYVMFAGIRTGLTFNVGTAPLAFLIGGGGLGELIFTGIALADTGMMLAGAIATALLAVAVDSTVALAARLLVPRGVRP